MNDDVIVPIFVVIDDVMCLFDHQTHPQAGAWVYGDKAYNSTAAFGEWVVLARDVSGAAFSPSLERSSLRFHPNTTQVGS